MQNFTDHTLKILNYHLNFPLKYWAQPQQIYNKTLIKLLINIQNFIILIIFNK